MKFTKATAFLLSLLMLTGCSKPVAKPVSAPVSNTSPTSENSQSATAEQTTEAPTTQSVTTTMTVSEPPAEAVIEGEKSLDVYSEITVIEFITNTNVEILNGNELIDTSKTGIVEIPLVYVFNGTTYNQPIECLVEDKIAPTLLNSGGSAMIETGEKFELTNVVGVADNYDKNVRLTYEGTVNSSVPGKYPIHAYATDASGNCTDWNLTVTVVDKFPQAEDNNARLSFDTFKANYGGENRKLGIDVSKWQGDIDFNAVKNAGCDFVIMRIGTYYDEHAMDKFYQNNIKKAKEAGLEIGVYLYTTANTEAEIKENAKWIADTLGGQKLDFPVVFDWESFGNFQQYEMSIHDLNSYFELFNSEMENYGYSAMLYSSKNFLNNFWYVKNDYPVWLAHYTNQTDYNGVYDMWQMSCYGRIDGINADVDLNILYTD